MSTHTHDVGHDELTEVTIRSQGNSAVSVRFCDGAALVGGVDDPGGGLGGVLPGG
ncbi:hypothetical protein ACH4D5_23910 [Streptomyces sp. NPDC018029]|uniref:hypothetical protein n=1 Tax=Streptomyces sp. NPDC018029 TaxID=3365032 RepID=UPI0037BAF445